MKTVKEWLTEWEHPAAEKALMYAEQRGTLDTTENSLSNAIFGGFVWEYTLEGKEFWRKIHIALYKNEAKLNKQTNEQL